MKLDYCYHSHTKRCGHAIGEDEEYVINAIKAGIKILGFTDHILLPGIVQKGIRGNYEELDNYLSSVNNLRNKYKDQIKIYVGFECEYLPSFLNYYQSLLDTKKVDYLICGQHFFEQEDGSLEWYRKKPNCELQASLTIKAIESGLYKYIAHPDILVRDCNKWDDEVILWSRKIIESAIKNDVPLELNLGMIDTEKFKNGLEYPYKNFWKLVSEYGDKVKTIIGVDAHEPTAFITKNYNFVDEYLKEFSLNIINRIKI